MLLDGGHDAFLVRRSSDLIPASKECSSLWSLPLPRILAVLSEILIFEEGIDICRYVGQVGVADVFNDKFIDLEIDQLCRDGELSDFDTTEDIKPCLKPVGKTNVFNIFNVWMAVLVCFPP